MAAFQPAASHTGLWFDKFCDQWPTVNGQTNWSLKSFSVGHGKDKEERNPKLNWIKTVAKANRPVGDKLLIQEHKDRLADLTKKLGGETLPLKSASSFASGLGREHPIENGFVWHPTLGVPYLPGSSVKGLVRAWVEGGWQNQPVEPETFHRVFGSDYRKGFDQYDHERHLDSRSGSVIFLDALPTTSVKLQPDVMTPHYSDYYADKNGKTAPGDWLSPIPIPFLTVAAGTTFQFAIVPRTQLDKNDVHTVLKWLEKALLELGAGAKTAVGYGRFVPDTKAAEDMKKTEEAAAKASREAEEKAAFTASLANLSPLARELMQVSHEQKWESDPAAFKKQGTREEWMSRLESDLQPDAIRIFGELIEKHDKDILSEPDRKEGKKNKPAYKEASISIAKKWNALPKP